MTQAHYTLRYRLDQRTCYLLWYSNDGDGVVVDASGHIPVFSAQADLRAYAVMHALTITQEQPILHNLDAVTNWLRRKRPTQPDCNAFLGAWNLLADVSNSVGGSFDPDKERTVHLYRKLFWGSNLPVMTPPGEHFEPHWSGKEYQEMREVLRGDLSLFRSHTRLRRGIVTQV